MTQRKLRIFFIINICLLVASNLWPASLVMAQTSPSVSFIISDYDLRDYTAMDLNQIQSFLVNKKSTLANYKDPITKLAAAQVIYQSAQDFQISPKFLLALIQKEQSLVEHANPQPSQYDWATGYAVCDSCTTDDPLIQKFKGFYNQVYNAAKRISTVYWLSLETKGATDSGFGPGIPKLVDGLTITPANKATAALYTYTPHLHGNELFAQVWQRFFAQTYPDGTLLQVGDEPMIWLIENGFRRAFSNQSVYLSRYNDYSRLIKVSPADLNKYPEGRMIKFANYSYLKIPSGTVYLLVNNDLRGFASAEALRKIGVNPEEIISVTQEDINEYQEAEPITVNSVYPLGALLQDKASGGVYWVKEGIKHPIWSREIMTVNFPNKKIIVKTTDELAKFTTGMPVRLPEGELVKSADDPAVYLISNGLLRPFSSAEDFEALGFKWQNIINTTAKAMSLHDLGEPIVANL